MALKTITFYNEKGNVSANARNAIKEQAKAIEICNTCGFTINFNDTANRTAPQN